MLTKLQKNNSADFCKNIDIREEKYSEGSNRNNKGDLIGIKSWRSMDEKEKDIAGRVD